MSRKIQAIQRALVRHGFNPGPIDGIWGRRTIASVRKFQTSRGLKPDGIVGPLTAAELFGSTAQEPSDGKAVLPWYEMARRLMGVHEAKGEADNPEILEWADDLDLWYDGDDRPWCGLFVAHCIATALPEEVLPARPLLARNWTDFGEACEPMRGAALVFWRGSRESKWGHVGFYEGEDDEHYFVLGGNQSDAVNVAKLKKERLLKARWPTTAYLLTSAPVRMSFGAPVSRDEA